MGVLEAAALHADPEGEAHRGDGRRELAARGRRPRGRRGQRLLLEPLHRAAAAARSDHRRRAEPPADRRGRQVRPGVRGVPARGALGLPGERARDRHLRREAQAARLPHLERRARDERRAEAPLPAPLHRLPERGARAARILEAKVPGVGQRLAEELVGRDAAPPQARSQEDAVDQRDPRLGAGAAGAERDEPRRGAREGHAERDPQVRGRHQEGAAASSGG